MTSKKISITLNEKDFIKFRNFCAYKGYTISSRINVLINNDMEYDRKTVTNSKLNSIWDQTARDIKEEWNGIFADKRKKGK